MTISVFTGRKISPEQMAEYGLSYAPPPKRKGKSKPRTPKPTKAQLAAQAKRQAAWRER